MDYTRCVAHYKRGKRIGQRCTKKGTHLLFFGAGQLKVCPDHFDWYTSHYLGRNKWMAEIVRKGILGRYNTGA